MKHLNIFLALLFALQVFSQVQQEWVRNFDFQNTFEYPCKVLVDTYGNIFVAGTTHTASTSYDFLILKYSPTGVLLWAKNFNSGGDNQDECYDAILDSSGNIIVTGSSYKDIYYRKGVLTIKYNSNGDSVWTSRF